MRILHLLSQTELTGSEVYAETLARDQHGKGHSIRVISDRLHRPFPGTHALLAVSTGSFWRRMLNIWKLIREIREHRIELIHCHSRAACRHAYWATRFTGTPMVTTLHGYQHASFSKRLFDIYGDTVITVCERIRDQLREKFAMDPTRIKTLRNPLELAWNENPVPDRPSIALIGRSTGPKGRRLRQVFRENAKEWLELDPQYRLELILPGLAADEAQALRSGVPPALQNRVSVVTSHQDLTEVFNRAQVVVASGRIAVEALAAGCEVIALGEARLEGRVSEENLPAQLVSNFGDVGPEEILDPQAVTHELRRLRRDPLTRSRRERLRELISAEFSQSRICDQIEEIYRATRMWKKAPGLPVLMYHKIPDRPLRSKHRIFVTKENFEKHLLFFQARGFETLTFDDLADFWWEKRPLDQFPPRPLLLTFDDGYRDNLVNALPLLAQYKMKATLFLLADHRIDRNTWDAEEGVEPAPLMTLDEKKALPPEVFAIGSHGLQHLDLRTLSEDEVSRQMTESKEKLEKDLGRPIQAFAYPFGWVDSRLPELARRAGYLFAVNTDRGALRWVDDRFSVFRVNIFPEESWFSLWRKTSRWYRRRYFRKRGK